MSARAVHLVIDARPRGPHGLLAAEVVLGKSVLDHLLDLAVEHVPAGKPVVVHARGDEHRPASRAGRRLEHGARRVRQRAAASGCRGLADRSPLRPRPLRRGLRRGRSPESAVVWRLDRPESLSTADQELTRRLTYQPLGKYWAFPLAGGWRSGSARPRSRPNALTLAAGTLDALGGGDRSPSVPPAGSAGSTVALSLALALVLDTADGRLARLQGTSSAFGRWLDQVLDELADLALHAAIAWAAFVRDGRPIWLVLGIIYASGKYLFLIQSLLGDELEGPTHRRTASGRDARSTAGTAVAASQWPRPAGRARSADRPRRRAVASLDRARARGPARRRAGGLCRLLPGAGLGRSGQEGGSLCLSPACRS